MRVLILGGTGEARILAESLHGRAGYQVISSLAGRTSHPALPPGALRVGGFGDADGLARYLGAEAIDVLVDATHPFAGTMSAQAARAAEVSGVRLLALRRPGWSEGPGDRWVPVPSFAAAAREVVALPDGGCVFVTTGRRGLDTFAGDDRHTYLIRSVEPPAGALPPRRLVVLARGPYAVAGETDLMGEHGVTALVTKNSGGTSTAAKLAVARHREIQVIMIEPPPPPAGVHPVGTVGEIVARLAMGAP